MTEEKKYMKNINREEHERKENKVD